MGPVLRHWPGRGTGARAVSGSSLERPSRHRREETGSLSRPPRSGPSPPSSPDRRRPRSFLVPLHLFTTNQYRQAIRPCQCKTRTCTRLTHSAHTCTDISQRPRLPASSPHFSQPSLLVGRKSCQRRTRGHRTSHITIAYRHSCVSQRAPPSTSRSDHTTLTRASSASTVLPSLLALSAIDRPRTTPDASRHDESLGMRDGTHCVRQRRCMHPIRYSTHMRLESPLPARRPSVNAP